MNQLPTAEYVGQAGGPDNGPKNLESKNPYTTSNYRFSQETIDSVQELGSVLERIHKRLTSEGYKIINGKMTKNGKIIERRKSNIR